MSGGFLEAKHAELHVVGHNQELYGRGEVERVNARVQKQLDTTKTVRSYLGYSASRPNPLGPSLTGGARRE